MDPEIIIELATAFALIVREELPTSEFLQMQGLNKEEEEPSVCHSHDFLDANTVMAQAFEEVLGRPAEVASDGDAELWKRAWEVALQVFLKPPPGEK